jgi:solute carrier family 35 protein F1/2
MQSRTMSGMQETQLDRVRKNSEEHAIGDSLSNIERISLPPQASSTSNDVHSNVHLRICDPIIYLQCCQQLAKLLSFAWVKVFSNWKILLFGQALSFLLASVEAVQSTLSLRCNLSAPAFTFGFVYLCLSFHLILLCRQHRRSLSGNGLEGSGMSKSKPLPRCIWPPFILRAPIWAYMLIALIEVEANYVTVLSLSYTTLTSATALKAMSIPTAIIISRVALGRRYSYIHFFGVAICIVGCILNILQDYKSVHQMTNPSTVSMAIVFSDGSKEYPHKVRGDGLAILAGILLGANDVVQELLVRQMGGTTEFLGMMGWCATWISLAQAAVLERDQIAALFQPDRNVATCSLAVGWWLVRAFVFLAVLNYICTARFLSISEAAFLNLSMLTGDLWSVLFSIVAQGIAPRPVFYGSLVCIVSGVLLYGAGPSPIGASQQQEQEEKVVGHSTGMSDEQELKQVDGTRATSPISQYV